MPIDIFNPNAYTARRRRTEYQLTVTIDGANTTRTLTRRGNAAEEVQEIVNVAYCTENDCDLTARDENLLDRWDTRRPLQLRDAPVSATITERTR